MTIGSTLTSSLALVHRGSARALEAAHAASGSIDELPDAMVGLSLAKLEVGLGVRLAQTDHAMAESLLDILA